MGVRVVVGQREPIGVALKRLRRMLERTRKRRPGHFIRDCEIRRHKEFRKRRKARLETEQAKQEGRQ